MILGTLGVLMAMTAPSLAAQRLDLDLASTEWDTSVKGAFSVHLDRRGVLTMRHASVPARNGDFAAISRTVHLPQDRRGPLVLRFYLADDYCGDKEQAVYFRDAVKERISDWKEEVRFCEVLLDDVLVWSKDVIGRNGTTAGERFYDLEISDFVKDRHDVALAFRVKDTADTEDAPFPTDVFWARPELLWGFGETPPPVEFPPPLPFRREKFRPTVPPAPLWGSTTLTVRNPSGVSLPWRPVRWGVPLPQGAVTKATQLALTGPNGEPVTLEAEVTSRWPDGSAKWVLLGFVAPLAPGDAKFTLQYGAAVTGAQKAPEWEPSQPQPLEGLELIVGAGEGQQALVAKPAGEGKMRRLALRTETLAEVTFADVGGRVVARGQVQVWHYPIETPGQSVDFARFTLEVGGQAEGLKVRRLVLDLSPPARTSHTSVDGKMVAVEGPWPIRQEGENAITGTDGIEARQGHWDGWVFVEALRQDVILLRWPWQQYPLGFATDEKRSSLRLLDVPDGQPSAALAPGEAKTWQYVDWTAEGGLNAEQAVALNAVYQKPPVVVFEPGWVAATGALGPFLEQDERRFPEYEAAAGRVAPGVLAQRDRQKAYGWESFGDLQFDWGFGEALTYWQNTEYDHAHALLWQFLRTGDPGWFYLGEQAAMHYRDVDLIHANDEHPHWIGGAHHHSETHTGHPLSISHHWTEGLFDHWLLTGDLRSLECGRLAAEYAARVALASGYGGGERDAGWNLIALMALTARRATRRC